MNISKQERVGFFCVGWRVSGKKGLDRIYRITMNAGSTATFLTQRNTKTIPMKG